MSDVLRRVSAPAVRVPDWLLLAGFALAVRLVGLGRAPFWMDEASTAGFAALPWRELLFGVGRLEPNPPAFYALEKLWTAVAGGSDGALRLPSVVFGVLGVLAVARLARDAFGRRAGVWAGVLMATQAHHLDHSREARVYALLFLSVALAALAGRRVALAARWRWRDVAVLALAGGAPMLLHNTGVMAAGCVFVYAGVVAVARPGARLRRLAALGLAGAGALAVGLPQLLAMRAVVADGANNASWIPVPDAVMTLQVALSVFAVPLQGIRPLPGGAVLAAFAAAAAVSGLALGWGVWHARRNADAAGMVAAVLVAVGGLYGVSQVVPVLLERTLLFSLVMFVPLLGGALASVAPPVRIGALALLLLVQAPGWAAVFGPARHGEDWAGFAALARREVAQSGWPVVAMGGFEAVSLDRYLPPGDPARPAVSITPTTGARLTEPVTRLMAGAVPIPQGADGAALCRALDGAGRGAGGVLLVVRHSAVLPEMEAAVATMLRSAGGTRAATAEPDPAGGGLALQRWRWRDRACLPTGAAP